MLSGGGVIGLAHLPPAIAAAASHLRPVEAPPPGAAGDAEIRRLHIAMKEFEREYLLRAIAQAHGKRAKAAEMLGISRKSLWEKLRAHGLADVDADDL